MAMIERNFISNTFEHRLLEVLDIIQDKLESGQIEDITSATIELRLLISELQKDKIDKNQIKFSEIIKSEKNLEKAEKSFSAYIQWLQYINGIDDSEIKQDTVEAQILKLETNLPVRWDKNIDLIFIHNDYEYKNDIITALKNLGQKHVFIFDQGAILNWNELNEVDLSEIYKYFIENNFIFGYEIKFIYGKSSKKNKLFEETIVKTITDYNSRESTVKKYQDIWNENQKEGCRFRLNGKTHEDLKRVLKNKNILIVSPGPSLKKSIKTIKKKAKQYFIIIATAQSVPALIKFNIIPDFIIVTDPTDYSAVLNSIDSFEEISLIADDSVHVRFLNKNYKQLFTIFTEKENLGLAEAFKVDRQNFEGGTVSLLGCALSKYCGAKSITVVGQDLSFSQESYFVTSSLVKNEIAFENGKAIVRQEGKYSEKSDAIEVVGWKGEKLYTKLDYSVFLEQFKRFALQSKEVKLFNCSEGGAFIDGFLHCSLDDLITQLDTQKLDLQIDAEDVLTSERQKYFCFFVEKKESVIRDFLKIIGEILKLLDKKSSGSLKFLKKIDKKEKALLNLSKEHRDISRFFMSDLIQFHRDLLYVRDITENLNLSVQFYRKTFRNLTVYQTHLKEAKALLKN